MEVMEEFLTIEIFFYIQYLIFSIFLLMVVCDDLKESFFPAPQTQTIFFSFFIQNSLSTLHYVIIQKTFYQEFHSRC